MRCIVSGNQLMCSPVFSALPETALDRLASAARQREYKRGQIILHADDPAVAVYIIASGRVKIVRAMEEGEQALIRMLGTGEIFGELALLDDCPYSNTVVALEGTITYILERGVFL